MFNCIKIREPKIRRYNAFCRVLYPDIELKLIPNKNSKNISIKSSNINVSKQYINNIIEDTKRFGPILSSVKEDCFNDDGVCYMSTILGYESNQIFFPIESINKFVSGFCIMMDSVTIKNEIKRSINYNNILSEEHLYNGILSVNNINNKDIIIETCFILVII